jgi:hypothetical protein
VSDELERQARSAGRARAWSDIAHIAGWPADIRLIVEDRAEVTRKSLLAAIAAVTLAISGCVHQPPLAPPWIQTAAMARCAARGQPIPARPFRTDGCTGWPDRAWLSCCVEHDLDYWCGGRPQMRWDSDKRLLACLSLRGCGGAAGLTAWAGVRVLGVPWLPTRWRWGWGAD